MDISDEELEEKVKKVVEDTLDMGADDQVGLEDDIFEDLGADDLAVLDVVAALDDLFKIDLPADLLYGSSVLTVRSLIGSVREALEEDG